jgi:hypothetical protein
VELAVQVSQAECVVIKQVKLADSGSRQCFGGIPAYSSYTENSNFGGV